MRITRDLTQQQFDAACKRHGFTRGIVGGYYCLSNGTINVYARNGGPKRRSQLAYLIEQDEKYVTRDLLQPTR